MTEEAKKETGEVEATEKSQAKETAQEDIQEATQESEKPTSEDAKEPTESAEKHTTEDTKDPAEDANKPTSEDAQPGITESEETKDTEKNTKDFSKESNDSSEEQSSAGITDDELSRVFDAIPRKSKVALNRVESKMDNVKSAKSSPTWYPWLFSIIMIIGLMWAVVYYLTGAYPIPHIGAWNLCISFVTILVGFAMTMAWK